MKMKKKQETSSCSACLHLPHDLIQQVLQYLPAKSLMRFMCVSKVWQSTLLHPEFVRSHQILSQSRSDGNYSVTFLNHKFGEKLFVFFQGDHRPGYPTTKVPQPLVLKIKNIKHPWVYVSRPLDGLVCLRTYDTDYNVLVLNISTRQIVHLPKVPGDELLMQSYRKYFLGFDPVSKDFKVLYTAIQTRESCAIYTLGTSSWRELERPPKHFCSMNCCGACVNGTIYWVAIDNDSESGNLVAFDVSKEQFRTIRLSLPEFVNPMNLSIVFGYGCRGMMKLSVVQGQLAMSLCGCGGLLLFKECDENHANFVVDKFVLFPPDLEKPEGLRISGVGSTGEIIFADVTRAIKVYFDQRKNEWRRKRFRCLPKGFHDGHLYYHSTRWVTDLRHRHVENVVRLKEHDCTDSSCKSFLVLNDL